MICLFAKAVVIDLKEAVLLLLEVATHLPLLRATFSDKLFNRWPSPQERSNSGASHFHSTENFHGLFVNKVFVCKQIRGCQLFDILQCVLLLDFRDVEKFDVMFDKQSLFTN